MENSPDLDKCDHETNFSMTCSFSIMEYAPRFLQPEFCLQNTKSHTHTGTVHIYLCIYLKIHIHMHMHLIPQYICKWGLSKIDASDHRRPTKVMIRFLNEYKQYFKFVCCHIICLSKQTPFSCTCRSTYYVNIL